MNTNTSAAVAATPIVAWVVLALVSLALFGNYYVYDSIGPIADLLQRQLGFSDTQLGTLNAIYSAPNIVMVLVGGVLVDRFGPRQAAAWFTGLCLLGAVMTAWSALFPMMAAGRLVFGIGAESAILAITVIVMQWFRGSLLGFALGINLMIARAGSYTADLSPSFASPLYAQGWQPPLWLAAVLSAISFVAIIAYVIIDRRYAGQQAAPIQPVSGQMVWSDLWRFDRSFWYIVLLCVTFYAVIIPFRSTFAIKYFQHAHGLSLEAASITNSYVFLAAIFATPAFGWISDKLGQRALLMAIGSLMLPLSFAVLIFTDWSLWVTTAMLGISFSMVPAILWPSIAYLVDARRLGTAMGTMTVLQNVGLAGANLMGGWLNDLNGANEANPGGYMPMLWFFGILGATATISAWLLRRREDSPLGHGLERIHA